MPQDAYPVDSDLRAWLVDAGFDETLIDALDLEAAINAGIRSFEERTGRTFLPTDETRTFDLPTHPRGIVDLKADLVSASEVSALGTVQVAGTGYRLLPVNASDRGRPYAQIQFARGFITSEPASWGAVSVTGSWGWPGGIPDDVWMAMIQMAALLLLPQVSHATFGGLVRWSEADVSESYHTDPLMAMREAWRLALFGPDSKSGGDGVGGIVGIWRRLTVV